MIESTCPSSFIGKVYQSGARVRKKLHGIVRFTIDDGRYCVALYKRVAHV